MYVVLGANGHIGRPLAQILLSRGEPVTVVTRDPDSARDWQRRGARAAVLDVSDVAALHKTLRGAERLFLLNPPADPSTDTAVEERRTLSAILRAIVGCELQRVVAESVMGARPAERTGDLGVLYAMEQALAAGPVPAAILRAAYYMSNWDAQLASARESGAIHTFFPRDLRIPMVAPADIAAVAARLLTDPTTATGIHNIEGPARYTSDDVAAAFAAALGRPVRAVVVPRERWVETFMSLGFSRLAAESYARMTGTVVDETMPDPSDSERGPTDLHAYIADLVARDE